MQQDAYVLCRIFHKNNIGPPCGNRYTPFMEEEWDGEGVALIPVVNDSVRVEPLPVAGQDAYVLCRIFHKNNIGPPCGNRYTPFMEEEWDGEGVALIPVVNDSVRVEPLPVAGVNPEKYL
ncbi:hypothetical protein Bca52824_079167 [Brassica carinata]|uniref:NAC domain-containing protein n=1 Tax=Brassica carinata TaxID=52824 RepID=A0A8X7PZ32_BRACI|nr:hypothetical protein Bca52824_079167 [Brassica carinata]